MLKIVHDDEKYVEIWLTNAESQDTVLREGLKPLFKEYFMTRTHFWVQIILGLTLSIICSTHSLCLFYYFQENLFLKEWRSLQYLKWQQADLPSTHL